MKINELVNREQSLRACETGANGTMLGKRRYVRCLSPLPRREGEGQGEGGTKYFSRPRHFRGRPNR